MSQCPLPRMILSDLAGFLWHLMPMPNAIRTRYTAAFVLFISHCSTTFWDTVTSKGFCSMLMTDISIASTCLALSMYRRSWTSNSGEFAHSLSVEFLRLPFSHCLNALPSPYLHTFVSHRTARSIRQTDIGRYIHTISYTFGPRYHCNTACDTHCLCDGQNAPNPVSDINQWSGIAARHNDDTRRKDHVTEKQLRENRSDIGTEWPDVRLRTAAQVLTHQYHISRAAGRRNCRRTRCTGGWYRTRTCPAPSKVTFTVARGAGRRQRRLESLPLHVSCCRRDAVWGTGAAAWGARRPPGRCPSVPPRRPARRDRSAGKWSAQRGASRPARRSAERRMGAGN